MTQPNTEPEHNLLVVSDLHLGEDLRPGGASVSYFRHLIRLERELEKFLRHHSAHQLDQRPWRLVINGDMVDFMSMKILPEAEREAPGPGEVWAGSSSSVSGVAFGEARGQDARRAVEPLSSSELAGDTAHVAKEDLLYGLGFSERAAQKKLDRVIVRHQAVFRALGDFVLSGNALVIVVGNHDVEFHYERVQRTFVEWLCGLSLGVGANPAEHAAFVARIQFCPWFYYQENCIYIEHGHQFDEYCAFDYQLHPAQKSDEIRHDVVGAAEAGSSEAGSSERGGSVAGRAAGAASARRKLKRRRGKSRFALSMAHSGMRYFANQIPEYDPHTAEHWGVVAYARWASALGLRGLTRISYLYGLLVWKVVEAWYWMRKADGDRKKVHLDRLRALSRTWRITEDKLLALSALHRIPVTRRFLGVLRALFLDRVLLSGLGIGIALGLLIGLEGAKRLWGPALVLGLCLLVNERLGRHRLESSAQRLRAVPRLVQALVGAPFIVFGHSHAPERVALPNGAVYFNTGTWASDDVRLAFTHLVVRAGTGDQRDEQRAELRQWRDGESAPFELPELIGKLA